MTARLSPQLPEAADVNAARNELIGWCLAAQPTPASLRCAYTLADRYRALVEADTRDQALEDAAAHVEGDRLITPADETEQHLNHTLTRLASEIRTLPNEGGEER